MKKLQSSLLLVIVFSLVTFTLYEKVSSTRKMGFDFNRFDATYSVKVPDRFIFCGEPVPLYLQDVREKFDRELQVNAYWHSNNILMLKRAELWFPEIDKILAEEGVPVDFKYLAIVESALTNSVSKAGAAGFWQLMKETAIALGLEVNEEVDERLDPFKSTRAACRYLKEAHKLLGNWTNVAASYNMGIPAFQRAMKYQKADNYYELSLNGQTTHFVYRIMAVKEILENPEHYKIKQLKSQQVSYKWVDVTESIADLSVFAAKHGVSYKTLVNHNEWLIANSLTVKTGKSYRIKLPLNANGVQVATATTSTSRDSATLAGYYE